MSILNMRHSFRELTVQSPFSPTLVVTELSENLVNTELRQRCILGRNHWPWAGGRLHRALGGIVKHLDVVVVVVLLVGWAVLLAPVAGIRGVRGGRVHWHVALLLCRSRVQEGCSSCVSHIRRRGAPKRMPRGCLTPWLSPGISCGWAGATSMVHNAVVVVMHRGGVGLRALPEVVFRHLLLHLGIIIARLRSLGWRRGSIRLRATGDCDGGWREFLAGWTFKLRRPRCFFGSF